MRFLRLFGLLPLLVTGCPGDGSGGDLSVGTPSREVIFQDGFELGKIGPGWTGFAINPETDPPENSDSIDIVTDPVREGNYALKITVHPEDAVASGDLLHHKQRAELFRKNVYTVAGYTLGEEAREGTEYWYSWSVLIPNDFPTPDSDDWQVMGQWHDQPDPGQPGTGYGPPISVRFRVESTGPSFRVAYGRSDYGETLQNLDTPVEKGKWIDLVFLIRFSQVSDGFLEVWKDGVPLQTADGATRITGPNMYNAQPNSFRLGLYRGGNQTTTSVLYYDDVKIYRNGTPPTP